MKNKKAIFARIDAEREAEADKHNSVVEPVNSALIAVMNAIDVALSSGVLSEAEIAAYKKINIAICTM